MTKWYDYGIACVILMVGSCWCESLFTYYTIIPVAFGVPYRNCVRKLWKIWRCEIVLLCHLWLGLRPEYYVTVPPMMCLFQFIALLHGFKSLLPVPSSSEILIYLCAKPETLSSGFESLFS